MLRLKYVLNEVLVGLWRNVTMTVAMIITMSISLFMLGASVLLYMQVDQMKNYYYGKIEVSVFLRPDVTDAQRQNIDQLITNNPLVAGKTYETQKEAFDRFQQLWADSPDFVKSVGPNSLPESFRVKLKDPEQFPIVATAFAGRDGVEQVQDQKALLEKFFRVLNYLKAGAWGLALIMIIVAVLLISNTIRVAAFSRRRETGIMKLVGASSFSIQLPFLLEGAIAGLIGALMASGAIALFQSQVVERVARPAFPFTDFVGWADFWYTVRYIIPVGVALAALASFLTLRKYLRV
jgi:cell division transport system permease protein